jgi:predicted nucleotidyltransferase
MNLRDILNLFDQLLRQNGISYAVIGGYAVAAWGELRATRDLDLLCRTKDLESLKSALRKANLDFEHRTGDAEDPIADVIRIEVGPPGSPYEVDLLAGIRGIPEGIFERSRGVQIDDLEVPVASPEDMIVLKLLGGSARDLEDARGILRMQQGKLDLLLLGRLCPESLGENLEALLQSAGSAS